MQPSTLVLCLLAAAGIVAKVSCLTNGELYELIKDHAEEIEVADDGDDVITLPGDADQEIDIGNLIERMAAVQADAEIKESSKKSSGLSWWRRRRRRRRHHRRRKICNCSRRYSQCKCCIGKTFRVHLVFKRLKFKLSGCVIVRFLRHRHGFELTIVLCGRRVYHKEVSLRHGIALCYGVPGLKRFARVCFRLYNIDLRRKRVCAKVTGVLNLWIKRFRVHLRIGCFRIPFAEEKLNALLSDPDNWGYEQLSQLTGDVGGPESGMVVGEAEDENQESLEEIEDDLEDFGEDEPSPIDMTDFE